MSYSTISHRSQVPATAATYFGTFAPHPTVAQVFHPAKGWMDYPGRKYISASHARKLRQEGITSIALRSGNRVADFNITELVK